MGLLNKRKQAFEEYLPLNFRRRNTGWKTIHSKMEWGTIHGVALCRAFVLKYLWEKIVMG